MSSCGMASLSVVQVLLESAPGRDECGLENVYTCVKVSLRQRQASKEVLTWNIVLAENAFWSRDCGLGRR
jgi:hypothetical protein